MKQYAIGDLHLISQLNREAIEALPFYSEDWLIAASDVGETIEQHRYALSLLTKRFVQIVWVLGNHDLWTLPSAPLEESCMRGEEKYQMLVAICREYEVLTPEDPYMVWPGGDFPAMLVPLFLLYDYSFRPASIPQERALAWAEETDVICTDEALLHPDLYLSRIGWCQACCAYIERRLEEEISDMPVVFINPFPMRQALVRLQNIPRFSLWCGTRRTERIGIGNFQPRLWSMGISVRGRQITWMVYVLKRFRWATHSSGNIWNAGLSAEDSANSIKDIRG